MESQPTFGEIEKSIHAAAMAGEKCDARDAAAVIGNKTLQIELLQSQIDRMRTNPEKNK